MGPFDIPSDMGPGAIDVMIPCCGPFRPGGIVPAILVMVLDMLGKLFDGMEHGPDIPVLAIEVIVIEVGICPGAMPPPIVFILDTMLSCLTTMLGGCRLLFELFIIF